jgi:hypothetical protein
VDGGEALDLAVDPAEAALFVRVRIVDPSDLEGRGEEVLMNEEIVLGKEDATPVE